MGYQLHPGRPIQDEVRRIADRQFEQAIDGLRAVGDPESDEVVHTARRHIKKIRALLRLVRPAMGVRYDSVTLRLRAVSRMLAPVADGQAVVETLTRLVEHYPGQLPADTVAAVQARVVRREAAADEEAALNDVLETAAALLRAEREAVSQWTLRKSGFRAIAPGLERSARDGREAMAGARARFSSARYHRWRQRVKDQWLQVRLLQRRCADDALALHERHLEELDGCLGEYHNCVILRDVLTSDSSLAREDAALCLRLVRRYERDLRAKARALGEQVHAETPRHFVKWVRHLWYADRRRSTAERGKSWRPAA